MISHDVNTVSTKILESSDVGEAEKNDTDIVISSAVDGDKIPPTILHHSSLTKCGVSKCIFNFYSTGIDFGFCIFQS